MIQAVGSCNTKVSEILLKEDRAVFSAIQEGLDKANVDASSRAQMVGIPSVSGILYTYYMYTVYILYVYSIHMYICIHRHTVYIGILYQAELPLTNVCIWMISVCIHTLHMVIFTHWR